jgi:nucleoside phosphorylase
MTTGIILDNVAVDGVIVSGVAGSPQRIGDVVVPQAWAGDDGTPYAADAGWLALARRFAPRGAAALERCAMVPTHNNDTICLGFMPAIVVGGVGHTSDTFGNSPFKCSANGGPVFGCDASDAAAALRRGTAATPDLARAADDDAPASSDMETASIGRAATQRGKPFIAFRAVSDGADDPLGLPGFPSQFFAYYPLAAHNAAAAAAGFVAQLPR